MAALTELNGWVEHVEAAAVAGVDAMLRESGFMQPPTVHLFSTELDPPYLGYAVSRPFYRGQDAAEAVSTLGLLAGAVRASRVVVGWEHTDLCAALELPGPDEGVPPALMVVDADRHGHSVARHPMRLASAHRTMLAF